MEDPGVDGDKILIWALKKLIQKAYTGLTKFRIDITVWDAVNTSPKRRIQLNGRFVSKGILSLPRSTLFDENI